MLKIHAIEENQGEKKRGEGGCHVLLSVQKPHQEGDN